MSDTTLIPIVIGLVISIIGYFLKATIDNLKRMQEQQANHNTSIEILKQNHNDLEKKFDSITAMIRDISSQLREISITLANKKDREK